jgi:hypothetical protein
VRVQFIFLYSHTFLSQPVQTLHEFLILVNSPGGEKKQNRNGKDEYGSNGMAPLMFYETVYFLEIQKNIAHGQQDAEDGQAALEFPVFIKKDIYSCYADQGNRYDEYPDVETCRQILKAGWLTGRFDIPAVKRIPDGEKSTDGCKQEPDRLHSL